MARNRHVSGLSWEGRGRVVTRNRLQLELAYALYDGVVRHSCCGNRQRRDRSPGWKARRPGKERRGLEPDQALPPGRSSPSASREHWKVLPERRLGAFGREASGEQGVGDKAENDQTRDHKPVADATHNPQTPRTFPSGLCASGSNGEGHGWVSSVRAFATAVQRQDVRPSTWL
jgi:hypothetical protein